MFVLSLQHTKVHVSLPDSRNLRKSRLKEDRTRTPTGRQRPHREASPA